MKYLFFILLLIFFTSCNSDDDEQVVMDIGVEISVKDTDGNDLLNPNTPNALNQHEFTIFYDVNGEQVEYYEGNLDAPKGFSIYEIENEFVIQILLNADINTPYPITYIKWSETDMDTLKCKIDRFGASQICKKLWLNDELVWEAYETPRFLEIIK